MTFITYPQAVTLFPAAPIWSALFFLMLVTLALSTMFPTTENIATALLDQFPTQLRPYKFFVTAAVCFVLFILGLPLCTPAGIYILQLVCYSAYASFTSKHSLQMDSYAVGYALLILGFIEVIVLAWRYGADRVLDNVEVCSLFNTSAHANTSCRQ